jgi:prepilin-type processing-associated H-X9-DG protein
LVTVTCTGFEAPGVDIALIRNLLLSPKVQRINVGFMGCHGAINGLRAALAIIQAEPTAKVLLNATELCSLHYRFQWESEGIVGNALFADGSASVVLGQSPPSAAMPESWTLRATGSVLIPDSTAAMSWKIGDHGFEMLLTSDVSDQIERALEPWFTGWLREQGYSREDVEYWGIHPGGPRILEAVQSSLRLGDDQLQTSRSILAANGNMSSPTVLFLLDRFIAQRRRAGTNRRAVAVLLAFGPGLVAEIAVLTVGN